MTYRQLLRNAVKQANKKPMLTLKRIAKESDLIENPWTRYRPLDKSETGGYTKKEILNERG